jgi:hypothetical protein
MMNYTSEPIGNRILQLYTDKCTSMNNRYQSRNKHVMICLTTLVHVCRTYTRMSTIENEIAIGSSRVIQDQRTTRVDRRRLSLSHMRISLAIEPWYAL